MTQSIIIAIKKKVVGLKTMPFSKKNDTSYKRSNAICRIDFQGSRNIRKITLQLLKTEEADIRESIGQLLLDELSQLYRISPPKLIVLDAAQKHSKKNGKLSRKIFGTYKSGNIEITNRTAIREKVVASRTFLDTLIHEFMHHFDFFVLKLSRSLHTAGFFARLNEVKNGIS